METGNPIVEVQGIGKSFNGVTVLNDVTFDVYPGKVHALLGENGAGKSTLVNVISGVFPPTAGTLRVEGKQVGIRNPLMARKLGIALIHQEPMCFQDLNVTENIFAGHTRDTDKLFINWKEKKRIARKLLDSLDLEIGETQMIKGMSIADQQMVEIVCALSTDAKVIIMDEPTASLSMGEVQSLFRIIEQLKEQGKAIIFIGHRLDEIEQIADRIVVLRDGEKVAETDADGITKDDMVRMMIGREINELIVSEEHQVGDTMLEARGLSIRGKFRDVSLKVHRGEIVGMAGLVGAGRTEVALSVFGITPPEAGRLFLRGKEVKLRNPREAIREKIAMVPEDRNTAGLIMPMQIRENMTFASMDRISKAIWIDRKKEDGFVADFAKKLKLKYQGPQQPAKELSGGNAQKVVLSKWLMTEPDLIILAAPPRGIDVGAKAEVYKLINELAAEGKAVLMISSEMSEVIQLCDRVYVMCEGKVTAELQKEDLSEVRIMTAASNTGRQGGEARYAN